MTKITAPPHRKLARSHWHRQPASAPVVEDEIHPERRKAIGVSPKMFAEFILPYQIAILERFRLKLLWLLRTA